jgi:hypothetical protein
MRVQLSSRHSCRRYLYGKRDEFSIPNYKERIIFDYAKADTTEKSYSFERKLILSPASGNQTCPLGDTSTLGLHDRVSLVDFLTQPGLLFTLNQARLSFSRACFLAYSPIQPQIRAFSQCVFQPSSICRCSPAFGSDAQQVYPM